MDLQKLYESQMVLRNRINYNEPDRFNKLVLALLVEIGECANEWRGFKFWSKNQKPRLKAGCPDCKGQGEIFNNSPAVFDMVDCYTCKGQGYINEPLLEEYVDGLHFVLEIGIEVKACDPFNPSFEENITEQFRTIYYYAAELNLINAYDNYEYLVSSYLGLGEMLGFTWEQIEQAYYDKNKINHERQENGY